MLCKNSSHAAGIFTNHNIEYASGNARLIRKFRHRQGRQRRLARGPDDKGTTCCQGGGCFTRHHGVGEIPRRDSRYYTYGLFDDHNTFIARRGWNGVAVYAPGFF